MAKSHSHANLCVLDGISDAGLPMSFGRLKRVVERTQYGDD